MSLHLPGISPTAAGVVLLALLIPPGSPAARQASSAPVSADERLLGELDPRDPIWVGQGAAVVAWKAQLGNRSHAIVTNGERGPTYEDIVFVVLSPDGRRLAYTAVRQRQRFAVIDGQEGKAYEDVTQPVFSGDGKHVAYVARPDRKRQRFVLDGKEVGAEVPFLASLPTELALSHDGSRWAFWVRKTATTWGMVVDGEVTSHSAETVVTARGLYGLALAATFLGGKPVFSPDGRRLAYVASSSDKRRGGVAMVLDGREGRPYDRVSSPTFSPDGSRFAFVAEDNGKLRMVVDEVGGPQFDGMSPPVFSSDGSRLAYVGINTREAGLFRGSQAVGCVVVDGQPGPTYQSGRLGLGLLAQVAIGGKFYRDKEITNNPERSGVSIPVFSPDGRHVVYTARRKEGDIALVMDRALKEISDLRVDLVLTGDKALVMDRTIKRTAKMIVGPRFLPDGRLSYAVFDEGKVQLVWDDTSYSGVFDDVGDLVLSENGRHHAFVVWKDRLARVVVDLLEGTPYNEVHELSVSNDGVARFVARRGRAVYLVQQRVADELPGLVVQHGR